MKLNINGEDRDFTDPLSLQGLVTQLGMKPDRVAVELNREIVPRDQWPTTALKDGDRLEIVHFVGGGSGVREVRAISNLNRAEPEPRGGSGTRQLYLTTCC
jgi:sulfur carrier protein